MSAERLSDERIEDIRDRLKKYGASAMDEGDLLGEIDRLRSLRCQVCEDDEATLCDRCSFLLYGMNP